MRARHIAFINFPHPPHVNSALPIVSILAKRGHRVSFVTSERFASVVEEAGAEVVTIPAFDVNDRGHSQQDGGGELFRPYARRMLQAITPFYDQNRPDLVIYDFMAYAGRILSKRLDLPSIQSSPFYAFSEDDFEAQLKHKRFRGELVAHAQQIAEFYRDYGIDSNNYRVDKEKLNLYLFPRVLQPNAELLGANC
jgi:UDP:flavonoid glycosyltransferase YjiC (YdhE family)